MNINTFTQTSEEPYERHNYEIVRKSNKKIVFDNWQDALQYWFTYSQDTDELEFVTVLDKKQNKPTKGFGNK